MGESLREYLEVAEYCVKFDKQNDLRWPNMFGCYGYPAALLLLSIAEAVGTEVMGGGDDSKIHFKILNHKDYYNLNLKDTDIEIIRNSYRNKLSHNAYMQINVSLDIGSSGDPLVEISNNIYKINLYPFLTISKDVVKKFISGNSPQTKNKI